MVSTLCLVAGFAAGLVVYHVFWADQAYRAGYAKATAKLKQQFERVVKDNSMFYAEDLGVVFVPKGGDTFEVVIPEKLSPDEAP